VENPLFSIGSNFNDASGDGFRIWEKRLEAG